MNFLYNFYGIGQEIVRNMFQMAGWQATIALLVGGAGAYAFARLAGKLTDFWMEKIRYQWGESKNARAAEKASYEAQLMRYQTMIENHLSASSEGQERNTALQREMHEQHVTFSAQAIEAMNDIKESLYGLAEIQKTGFDKIEQRHGEMSPAIGAMKLRLEDLWRRGGS